MMDIPFSRGTLKLSPKPLHAHWSLDRLLDFAERINPKRCFLFVSKVLGKHIPVAPSLMQQTYTDLAALIADDLPQPITLIGMAETATCLSAGVHRALKAKYPDMVFVSTTRHPVHNQPVLAEFLEEHSHAQAQLIYDSTDPAIQQHIRQSKSLILVDDEASTGKTFVNLVAALQQAGLTQVKKIVTATLVNWSPQQAIHGIDSTHVALLSGQWEWQAAADAAMPTMPKVDHVAHGDYAVLAPQTSGRVPTKQPDNTWIKPRAPFKGEKILVIGSCEYTWPPFLAALALEQQGADVKFCSTTRSPISVGKAITHKITFKDNYGLGMPNFVYNIQPQHYDRIVLVAETSRQSIDPELLAQLPHCEVITYD